MADVDLKHHVRQHIAPVEHDRILEDDADVGLRPVDALVADRDRSGAVGDQSGDHLEDGGLAAAAGTDDGDELGLPDIEIDVRAGFDHAVLGLIGLADVLQPNVRSIHTVPRTLRDDFPAATERAGRSAIQRLLFVGRRPTGYSFV